MKKLLIVLLVLVFASAALGQAVAHVSVQNIRVDGDYLKWEYLLTRLDEWGGGNELSIIESAWEVNEDAFFYDPVKIYPDVIFDGVLNNANYSLVHIDWWVGGGKGHPYIVVAHVAGEKFVPALNIQHKLFTVSLQIKDKTMNSNLKWYIHYINGDIGLWEIITSSGDEDDFPLPVSIYSLSAEEKPGEGVMIHWNMENAYDVAELNIFRSEAADGQYARINSSPISVKQDSEASGYSYLDNNIREGAVYFYKVQEMLRSGGEAFYGPVEVKVREALPDEMMLTQNYPNPFNPETRIVFYLDQPGAATLTVYDMQGRTVNTLHEGMLSAGKHEALWHGNDSSGRIVASGVYFYVLRSGNQVLRMKAVFMK